MIIWSTVGEQSYLNLRVLSPRMLCEEGDIWRGKSLDLAGLFPLYWWKMVQYCDVFFCIRSRFKISRHWEECSLFFLNQNLQVFHQSFQLLLEYFCFGSWTNRFGVVMGSQLFRRHPCNHTVCAFPQWFKISPFPAVKTLKSVFVGGNNCSMWDI